MRDALLQLAPAYAARVLALALCCAAVAKLTNLDAFKHTLTTLGLGRLTGLVSLAIPLVEASLGIGFVAPMLRGYSQVVAPALFLLFVAVAFYAIHSHKRVKCSCFGSSEREIGWTTVSTNLLLVVLVWIAAQGRQESLTVPQEAHAWLGAAVLLTMVAIVGHIVRSRKSLGVLASD